MNRLLQVKPYGSSSHISFNELGTTKLTDMKILGYHLNSTLLSTLLYDQFSFMPFVWRNNLYIVTYHFAIYRIADKG